jgi:predicted ArsR family transcriptional regulator
LVVAETPSWTFLTNYSHVLLTIAAEPEIRIREVADRVGITERAAQRILADLVESGHLEIEKVGRRNRYSVNASLSLRHPIERENQVSALLALVRPDGKGTFGDAIQPKKRAARK